MKQEKSASPSSDSYSDSELSEVVRRMHGCRAILRERITITEGYGDRLVWQGVVRVFDIQGHPQTDTCYAWSSAVEGSTRRRYYAVLKLPPVDSPQDAVKAAIVADHKAGRSP